MAASLLYLILTLEQQGEGLREMHQCNGENTLHRHKSYFLLGVTRETELGVYLVDPAPAYLFLGLLLLCLTSTSPILQNPLHPKLAKSLFTINDFEIKANKRKAY